MNNKEHYTVDESLAETQASMSFSGMELSEEWLARLKEYALGNISEDELRKEVIDSISNSDITKD